MTIGAIILAAGSSRRFGDDKRKAVLPSGQTLIEATIHLALAVVDNVLVVVRAGDQAFIEALENILEDERVDFFAAPDSALGMAHSLGNAISRVHDWDGALIMLGDMPFTRPATITRVVDNWTQRRQTSPIVLPTFNDKPGHPVLFSRAYFGEIERLAGDRGARPVIEAHKDKLIRVSVDDAGVLRDVDRPEDLSPTR